VATPATHEAAWALARVQSVTPSTVAEHLRDEVIAFGDVHARLLAIEAELRRLGFAISAHSVRRDAKIVAGAVGWRASWLRYGFVSVAVAMEHAARDLHPFAAHLTIQK
jgi:hypothetical protein